MNRPTEDGGPAFPTRERYRDLDRGGESIERERPGPHGMTLRDYFAGQALMGLFAAGEASSPCILVDPKLTHSGKRCMTNHEFAECAYSYADAMLAARKEGVK